VKVGKVLLVIVGSIAVLVALGLVAAGAVAVWAHTTQRDADGFYATGTSVLASDSHAITAEDVDIASGGPDWFVDEDVLGTVRIRAEAIDPDRAIFVGIGPADLVDAYLRGVAHDQIDDVDADGVWPFDDPFDVTYVRTPGTAAPTPPGDQNLWAASVEGAGLQELRWEVDRGRWAAVLMNADGSAAVAAEVSLGARVGFVLPVGIGLLAGGTILLGLGALMVVLGVRGLSAAAPAAAPAEGPAAPPGEAGGEPAAALAMPGGEGQPPGPGAYPVAVTGRLDEPLSRWLWLVKWVLAIPHWFVLAFLWLAFFVVTFIAFFAILVTARYPRALFDFNVGVLRWTWRVTYYGYGGLATDRYPPFTLAPDPTYPADLHVEYPERLSRGLVLVKWWLLAIPHYLIVAVFQGGWGFGHGGWGFVWSGGVVGLLVFASALVLLVTGRYPTQLLDVVVGLQRWTYRVVAYAGLMRDEYPPFRLDP
jgi:hypothetical protein